MQSAGIWLKQTLTKFLGPQRCRKSRGRVKKEEGLQQCHFQAASLWSKALGEKENKKNRENSCIFSSPSSLSSMWRSVCSVGRISHCSQSYSALQSALTYYLQQCSPCPDMQPQEHRNNVKAGTSISILLKKKSRLTSEAQPHPAMLHCQKLLRAARLYCERKMLVMRLNC